MGAALSAAARTSNFSLPFIVWLLIAGVIIAFIIVFCNKRIIGALVRAIIDAEATSEETSKTLSELGQEGNTTAISLYKGSSSLKRIIKTVNPGEALSEENNKKAIIDENTRFYIPEDSLFRTQKQYGSDDSVLTVIIGTLAMIAVGIIVTLFIAK